MITILTMQQLKYIHENVDQVGSILFETNFIITQLAMFDLLLRFIPSGTECSTEHSVPEEGRRLWLKRRSKLNIASCVIMKFVSNN